MATSRTQWATQQLNEHWYHLRFRNVDLPGKHLLRMSGKPEAHGVGTSDAASLNLTEAVSIYIRLKGKDRRVTFHRATERACGYVIDACIDKDLNAYSVRQSRRWPPRLRRAGSSSRGGCGSSGSGANARSCPGSRDGSGRRGRDPCPAFRARRPDRQRCRTIRYR